jgi:hypothetical protein
VIAIARSTTPTGHVAIGTSPIGPRATAIGTSPIVISAIVMRANAISQIALERIETEIVIGTETSIATMGVRATGVGATIPGQMIVAAGAISAIGRAAGATAIASM